MRQGSKLSTIIPVGSDVVTIGAMGVRFVGQVSDYDEHGVYLKLYHHNEDTFELYLDDGAIFMPYDLAGRICTGHNAKMSLDNWRKSLSEAKEAKGYGLDLTSETWPQQLEAKRKAAKGASTERVVSLRRPMPSVNDGIPTEAHT